MRTIAGQLGGTYYDNPLWWAKRVITVHPLGGAPMGRHPGEGVCDEYGEVYGHPGLYVMDGALLPGPVGANPSLTIAAVADRACTHLLETTGSRHRSRPPHRSEVAADATGRAACRDPLTRRPRRRRRRGSGRGPGQRAAVHRADEGLRRARASTTRRPATTRARSTRTG